MTLQETIDTILKEQKLRKKRFIPVDIILHNGHIILRSFRLFELNQKTKKIKGLTYQEEYVHLREEREPVYCVLNLNEIKELYCPYLDLNYSQDKRSSLFESN